MYYVSTLGIDECMINVFCYYCICYVVFSSDDSEDEEEDSLRDQTRSPDSSVPV